MPMGRTGVNPGEAAELVAGLSNTGNQIEATGEDIIQNFARVTGDSLQGQSADGADQFAQSFANVTRNVRDIQQMVNRHLDNYSTDVQSTDKRFGAAIGSIG